jgi:hypothetical protein
VYPRNIVELIRLKDLQIAMVKMDPACQCKCGIELRPEVERNYGGYFYNNTLAGGRARCEQVKKLVEKHVGKWTKVLLKRGCTEMERDFGDSKEWDKFAVFNDLEDEVVKHTYYEDDDHDQSPLVKAHVLASWLKFAASIADPAFKELSDGESMYPDYSTFDEEEKNAEKKPDEGRIHKPEIRGYVPQGNQEKETK